VLFLVAIVRSHRAILVLSTVGLGVCGSLVADQPSTAGRWLLIGSFAVLLGLSDWCRHVDEFARELVRSAKVSYRQAAADFVSTRRSLASLVLALAVWLALLAASLVAGLGSTTPTSVGA